MFSLTARFRKSRTAGRPGAVYYVIRDTANGCKSERNITSSISGRDVNVISREKDKVAFDLMTIYCVIESMKSAGKYTLDDITEQSRKALFSFNPYRERISTYGTSFPVSKDVASISKLFSDRFKIKKPQVSADIERCGLLSYISGLAVEYDNAGKSYAKSLRNFRRSIGAFLSDKDVALESLTSGFVAGYQRYLADRVSGETTAYYMSVFLNVINHARRDVLIHNDLEWPTGVAVKRAGPKDQIHRQSLDIEVMREICRLDLTGEPNLQLTRDVFMFAFYAGGMELVDVANLKVDDLEGNVLTYNRRLKGARRVVVLGDKSMSIIAKYSLPGRKYLFPLIERKWMLAFKTVSEEVSRNLKAIGDRLRNPVKLTFSMNRYTWLNLIKTSPIAELLTL